MSLKANKVFFKKARIVLCVLLCSLVFMSCPSTTNLDTEGDTVVPDTNEEDGSGGEINLKFALPADTWSESVTAAKLYLYANAERFHNSAAAYTFDLTVTTSGTTKTVSGICRSITAGTYLMDVKILNSTGASLRRHLNFVTVNALTESTLTLDFQSTTGNLCLVSGAYSTKATATKISLCDPATKEVISTLSCFWHSFASYDYNFSLFRNVAPGTYTVYWELYDALGQKILEGYADAVTVSALADTKKDVSVSASFGSLRIGSATFTN